MGNQSPDRKNGGVAGVGERNKLNMVENDKRTRPEEGEVKDYLNAGFMMITPDGKTFDELRKVRGYKPFYMEQVSPFFFFVLSFIFHISSDGDAGEANEMTNKALLNHYFDWEGAHPWEELDPL